MPIRRGAVRQQQISGTWFRVATASPSMTATLIELAIRGKHWQNAQFGIATDPSKWARLSGFVPRLTISPGAHTYSLSV